MNNLLFKIIYFGIVLFLIYQNHNLSKKSYDLEETIYLQNRAIEMQNILINYYQKNPNFLERSNDLFYNPLNKKRNNEPI